MQILNLKNHDEIRLVTELKRAVEVERKQTAIVLQYLREVERRKIHLARGFSSLFAFCVEELRYSESEAHVRIQAMRLSQEIPAVAEKLERGKLSLTVAAMAQAEFRRENVRRNEARVQPMKKEEKQAVLISLESASKRTAQKTLALRFPAIPRTAKMTFDARPELIEKIERLKGLTAHKNFSGDLAKLVELAVDIALEKMLKSKPADDNNVNAIPSSLGPAQVHLASPRDSAIKRTRYISIKTKREVWARDRGQCGFIDSATGRRCSSRHGLEIDHIHEFSKGGVNEIRNLRLLCSAHNKFRNQARS